MTDRTLGDTFFKYFTTRAFATGIPTTLAGTPVISAYEDNSVTQITAGVSLGVDHDGVTGLHLITIVATGGNGFGAGQDYSLVITTGTVGGVSVVGEVVDEFTIESGAAFTRLGIPAGASTSADIADVPTVAEFNARTLVAASYFDPVADAVANVTLVATTTTNSDMRGTDSAALATALATAQTDLDTLTGTDGVTLATLQGNYAPNTVVPDPAGTAPTAVEINAEVDTALADYDGPTNTEMVERTLLAAAYFDPAADAVANVTLVGTTTTNTDMRGTDSAALASELATAQTDLDTITGTDGVTLATLQALYAPNVVVPDAAGVVPTAAQNRQEMDGNSSQLAAILDIVQDSTIPKNMAYSNFMFLMVLSSDNVTPATGLTVTGQRSLDAGAFAAVSGTIAEISNGIYQFDALAADTNGDLVTWRFSSATANDTFVTFQAVT